MKNERRLLSKVLLKTTIRVNHVFPMQKWENCMNTLVFTVLFRNFLHFVHEIFFIFSKKKFF